MMESARKQKQPVLNKDVQRDLNDYINKQKESILNLSRSSASFAEALAQNRQMFPEAQRSDYEMVVSSARVEIPRNQRNIYSSQIQNNSALQILDEDDEL